MPTLRILDGMRLDTGGFPKSHGENKDPHRSEEGKIDREAECRGLIQNQRYAEKGKDLIEKTRRIDGASDQHGGHHAGGLPLRDLLKHPMPFPGTAPLSQGIIDDRLVGAACQPLGEAAQDSVGQAEKKKKGASITGGHAEQSHLDDHAEGRRHE